MRPDGDEAGVNRRSIFSMATCTAPVREEQRYFGFLRDPTRWLPAKSIGRPVHQYICLTNLHGLAMVDLGALCEKAAEGLATRRVTRWLNDQIGEARALLERR